MRCTQGARIKRQRVVVWQLRFLQVYSHNITLRTCNEKQAPTQRFRDVVTMESIDRVCDLKVMPAAACGFRGSRAGLRVVDFDV